MIKLKVTYLEEDGNISENMMYGFVPFGDSTCSASLDGSDYMKPLLYNSILDAVDLRTGEIISVRELCGARPLPKPITTTLHRQARPKGKRHENSDKLSKSLRREDNWSFRCRYRNEVILNHYRNKLIDLFNGRCYACDNPNNLQMDHHVPLIKGGRKEPGNIVMLCYKCNAQKLDYMPEEFYSSEELINLQGLLDKERSILNFELDVDKWMTDRYAYLKEIGISPLLLDEIRTNTNHDWHIPESNSGISISI